MNLCGLLLISALFCGELIDSVSSHDEKQELNIGLILPHTSWRVREYRRRTMEALQKLKRQRKESFSQVYSFNLHNVHLHMLSVIPSPTAILEMFCESLLPNRVATLIHLTNSERFGRSTASNQYLSQLSSYLSLPIISWHADNSGLHSSGRSSLLQLQLSPSIAQQTAAMLAILQRYSWHRVFVLTSQIAGHQQFIQTIRNQADLLHQNFKLTIIGSSVVQNASSDLLYLSQSEARVILLYCTRDEATDILSNASSLHLTGSNFVWIVTQSVQGKTKFASKLLPIGMLGVHFETSESALSDQIGRALSVFVSGVELMLTNQADSQLIHQPNLSCNTSSRNRWTDGKTLFQYMRAVNISNGSLDKSRLLFDQEGSLIHQQLVITNLRQGSSSDRVWEPIGIWRSSDEITGRLEIRDIVWPGYSPAPPQGVPEKFHLKIAFMEESPYIVLDPPDPNTGRCVANRGVPCLIPVMPNSDSHADNSTLVPINQCCSGFCIDLLEKFAQDLDFTYELVRNEDGLWGARVMNEGKLEWNGLPGSLIKKKADMAMTSFKINSYRQSAVDFTVPFLDTGITIVVAKRTGIISPTAFLEPFDTASWLLVSLVAIQAAIASIFFFEWLSPSGYNMKMSPPPDCQFSLFRTVWLVWSTLFQAATHVHVPRGVSARFMTSVWALFALIFLAIYTANLAAFMITREEFYNLKGIDDPKLQSPRWKSPAFRFGTVLHGNTDAVLKQNFPDMRRYMLPFNRSSVVKGIQAVKRGELDAFIYDATVLEYFSGEDDDCQLLTVGQWYAMTGYGVAFPRNSKYTDMFNQRILEYRQTGDIERLHRFWFTGSCKPGQNRNSSSKPLTLDQFLSAFMLLGCGILVSIALLVLEVAYFSWFQPALATTGKKGRGLLSMLSLSLGRSLMVPSKISTGKRSQSLLHSHQMTKCAECDKERHSLENQLKVSRERLRRLHELYSRPLVPHTSWGSGVNHPTTRPPLGFRPTALPHHHPPSYIEPTYSTPILRQKRNLVNYPDLETTL